MRDEPIKPRMAADGPPKIPGVYRERRLDAGRKIYGCDGETRGAMRRRKMAYSRNPAFFDAPHGRLRIMPSRSIRERAADIGMYGSQTLMMALIARGHRVCAQGHRAVSRI